MSQIQALMWKELKQVPRKRGAMVSAALLPMLFLLIVPLGQMLSLSRLPAGLTARPVPDAAMLPATLQAINRDPAAAFRVLTLPLVVLLGGLIVPSVTASYTMVAEREKRTLDLLIALPVSIRAILWAKLLTVLFLGAAISLPLFAIDCAFALSLHVAGWADVLALSLLLLASLIYSTAAALVVSLLARDFRTANNVNGLLIGPLVLIALAALIVAPPAVGPALVACVLLVLAGLALTVALRWLTVERLLL